MTLLPKTNQQLVNRIRFCNYILSILNIVNFLIFLAMGQAIVYNLKNLSRLFNTGNLNTLTIWLGCIFGLSVIIAIISFVFSLYVSKLKTLWLQLYSLLFVVPIGLLLFYYCYKSHYWQVENKNDPVNWKWFSDTSSPSYTDQFDDNQTDNKNPKDKVIFRVNKLLEKIKVENEKDVNKLCLTLFSKYANKLDITQESFDRVLVLKVILELIPVKLWDHLDFNVQSYLDVNFAFGLKGSANERFMQLVSNKDKYKNYYYQVYVIFNVYDYGYDQLLETKELIKKHKRHINSYYILFYTNKIYKTYVNSLKK